MSSSKTMELYDAAMVRLDRLTVLSDLVSDLLDEQAQEASYSKTPLSPLFKRQQSVAAFICCEIDDAEAELRQIYEGRAGAKSGNGDA